MTRADKATEQKVMGVFRDAQARGQFKGLRLVHLYSGYEVGHCVGTSGWVSEGEPMTAKEALDYIMLACEPV